MGLFNIHRNHNNFLPLNAAVLVSLFAASVEITVPAAFAQGAASPKTAAAMTAQVDGSDPKFQDCGPGCLYGRANEATSLLVGYTVEKVALLDGAYQQWKSNGDPAATPSGDFERLVQTNLGEFCYFNAPQKESEEDCYKRFKTIQLNQVEKMRSTLVRNKSMQSRLEDNRRRGVNILSGQPGGAEEVFRYQIARGGADAKTRRSLPLVPTFQELSAEYQRQAAVLGGLSTQAYQEWAGQMPHQPSPEDYVLFEEVPRDPLLPRGEKIRRIRTSATGCPAGASCVCNSSFCYDPKAYADAQARYQDRLGDFKKEQAMMLQSVADARATGRYSEYLPYSATRPKNLEDSTADESKDAFRAARAPLAAEAQQLIGGAGAFSPGEVTFSGSAARAPSQEQKTLKAGRSPIPAIADQPLVESADGSSKKDQIRVIFSPESVDQNLNFFK